MTGRPRDGNDPQGPEDHDAVDAAFAKIIADLEQDGFGSATIGEAKDEAEPDELAEPIVSAPSDRPVSAWRGYHVEWDWEFSNDDEHYVPPEPPPLPRLRVRTIIALVLIVLGVLLLVAPALVGFRLAISAPVALVLMSAGLGLLMLRVRSGPPAGPGDDDGAQV